mmetsp:Transcript_5770/g.8665  ORF Transcript_5770/g.8665 Transcript_5770/m.8665 type:complete len:222 (+) Transcript_5770:2516-3181(+)
MPDPETAFTFFPSNSLRYPLGPLSFRFFRLDFGVLDDSASKYCPFLADAFTLGRGVNGLKLSWDLLSEAVAVTVATCSSTCGSGVADNVVSLRFVAPSTSSDSTVTVAAAVATVVASVTPSGPLTSSVVGGVIIVHSSAIRSVSNSTSFTTFCSKALWNAWLFTTSSSLTFSMNSNSFAVSLVGESFVVSIKESNVIPSLRLRFSDSIVVVVVVPSTAVCF